MLGRCYSTWASEVSLENLGIKTEGWARETAQQLSMLTAFPQGHSSAWHLCLGSSHLPLTLAPTDPSPTLPHMPSTSPGHYSDLPPHWHSGFAHWSRRIPAAESEAGLVGPISSLPANCWEDLPLRLPGETVNIENVLEYEWVLGYLPRNSGMHSGAPHLGHQFHYHLLLRGLRWAGDLCLECGGSSLVPAEEKCFQWTRQHHPVCHWHRAESKGRGWGGNVVQC